MLFFPETDQTFHYSVKNLDADSLFSWISKKLDGSFSVLTLCFNNKLFKITTSGILIHFQLTMSTSAFICLPSFQKTVGNVTSFWNFLLLTSMWTAGKRLCCCCFVTNISVDQGSLVVVITQQLAVCLIGSCQPAVVGCVPWGVVGTGTVVEDASWQPPIGEAAAIQQPLAKTALREADVISGGGGQLGDCEWCSETGQATRGIKVDTIGSPRI